MKLTKAQQYYLDNKEKILSYNNNKYRVNNPDSKRYKVNGIVTEEERAEKSRQYYLRNRERIISRSKSKGKEKIKLANQKYYNNNKAKHREICNRYRKKKWKDDPSYAMCMTLRSNLNKYFHKCTSVPIPTSDLSNSNFSTQNNRAPSLQIIGCTRAQLIHYIEKQFDSNMNWSNRVSYWNVDHIIPVSYFIKKGLPWELACHYTNYQPLESHYNQWIKRDNVIKEFLPKIYNNPDAPDHLVDIALSLMLY